MNTLRSVIVEDIPSNHQRLTQLLHNHCKEVNVIAIAETVEEAIRVLSAEKPDLVFLDVELPDGTGFDILNFFSPLPFKIIFFTGHQEYAYQAIKFHAADFLLKPVKIPDLIASVNLVLNQVFDDQYKTKIETIRRQYMNPEKITLFDSTGFIVLESQEIIKLEADGCYTDIYLTNNRKLTYCKILKAFEDLLKGNAYFMRTHRSNIVNLNHVQSFSHQGILKLKDGLTANLGDSYRQSFLNCFSK